VTPVSPWGLTDAGNNGLLPPINDLPVVATLLNLMILNDPAFINDYRTGVANFPLVIFIEDILAAIF
jgi:hypothetical protein